jgi:hypothetical protein
MFIYYLIKSKIKLMFPNYLWKKFSKIKTLISPTNWGQVQIRSSEKQIVYVIRRRPPGGGLFSNIRHVLEGLINSIEQDYIPVVDMKNYPTMYSSVRKFNGTYNAWNYFFEPVSHVSLEAAYASESLILSAGNRILSDNPISGKNLQFILDKDILKKIHNVYKNNIKLNSFTIQFLEDLMEFIGIDIDRSLGVFYRSDKNYIESGHPKQPEIENVIQDIKLFYAKYPINSLFISTDSKYAREIFESEFKKSVYKNFRPDFDQTSVEIADFFSKYRIPTKEIMKALSYLAEIYISAMLPYNIASITNGSAAIHIINGGNFKDSKLYDLGIH